MRSRPLIRFCLVAALALASAAAHAAEPARPADLAGFRAARWGMDDAALDATFGDALGRLADRRVYGDAYATRYLAAIDIGDAGFRAFFQMNAADGTLQQVLLEPLLRGRQVEAFHTARDAFAADWGTPDARCTTPADGGAPWSATLVWRFPTTTVRLAFIDFRSPEIIYENERHGRSYAREARAAEGRAPLALDEPVSGADPKALPRKTLIRFYATARTDLDVPPCVAVRR